MIIVNNIDEMHDLSNKWRQDGKSIGLVPTMGYLHEGHLSLINDARGENDIVVTSIFVNPSQFGPNEDFERYPRDMEADSAACELAGVDVIFAPDAQEMYPEGYTTYVEPGAIGQRLCGAVSYTHLDVYKRQNKIRLELIPLLRDYNPNITEALIATADI